MAGGREGVDRMIEILAGEIVRTMQLLQVTTLDELEPNTSRSSPGSPTDGRSTRTEVGSAARRGTCRTTPRLQLISLGPSESTGCI